MLVIVVYLLVLLSLTSCLGQQTNQSLTAVFAFGDSILDTGNNNQLSLIARANYPPYGKDLPGKTPTGRWGNGRVLSDIVAEGLGVKNYLPPYLDTTLPVNELSTGVCFASGGSGLDTVTSTATQSIPMATQLNNFKEYIAKLRGLVGEDKANTIISNAMVIISAGNNDMGVGYASGRAIMGIPAYATLLISLANNFVRCFGANPLDGASVYNSKLSDAMQALNSKLTGASITYIDIYTPLLKISQNPFAYGFQVSVTGCCPIMGALCVRGITMTCPDSSKYVFWDGVHPSEAAYKAVVSQILHKQAGQLF
ncbi:GDSL esterase/lipase At1g73610 [Linum perenne]